MKLKLRITGLEVMIMAPKKKAGKAKGKPKKAG